MERRQGRAPYARRGCLTAGVRWVVCKLFVATMPRCWRATDAAGENHSDKHARPVRGSAAPRLNPVATGLSWSPPHCWQLSCRLQEKLRCARLGEETTPRNEVLLPAICRILVKHPLKKHPAGIPVARSTASPPNLRATGIALRARASPAEFQEPRFPLDLSEKQLLAAGTAGSLRLQIQTQRLSPQDKLLSSNCDPRRSTAVTSVKPYFSRIKKTSLGWEASGIMALG